MPKRDSDTSVALSRGVSPSLHPQLQKLAKSFGSQDNLALVPHLQKMSTTFQDVKRNGESLMLTATNQLQKLKVPKLSADSKLSDDWSFSGRSLAGPKQASVRRSASESTFQRPKWQASPQALSPPKQPAFDWLTTFNDTINQARTQPKFQLPSKDALGSQAKQLVHSASNVSLERVASQLLLKPKEALETAQQTLTHCQQNFQTLQLSLQQSFADGKSTLETRMNALHEPGSPSSSGNRLVELLSAATLRRKRVGSPTAAAAADDHDSTPEQLTEAVPEYLRRAGELSTIEALPTSDEDTEGEGAETSAIGKLWGPFQRHAERRKREQERPAHSSLRQPGRRVTIVTTAALPWMTGTAVNPLLRAAYLAKDEDRAVTLMIPWLAKPDQARVYPNNITFENPDEQEAYVKNWVRGRTGLDPNFKVTFYPGRYAPEKCSILPVGDPTAYVGDTEADVAILEEPEHLNWFHHGRRWTDKFNHVVGVVHTNYLDYARREEGGAAKETLLKHVNAWVTRIHCHKVVKLSDAVQPLPREETEFVHGVAESFLKVGEAKAAPQKSSSPRFTRGAYFIGKAVWGKGYTELLTLLDRHTNTAGHAVELDCYGTGEDLEAVRLEAERKALKLKFHGAKDHLDTSMHEYKVFINPSTSDVVATTTAEALAMGKWVVCADHPSNAFFSQFKNCLIFKTPEEFSAHVEYALATDPHPMDRNERQKLTWDAATERFLDVTELTERDLRPGPVAAAVDSVAWAAHNALLGVEPVRRMGGAGTNTRDNPVTLVGYQPSEVDSGGMFDDKKRAAKAYAKAK